MGQSNQAVAVKSEPENQDPERKVTPPSDHDAVTYGCSGERIGLQSIVNGLDSALSRFRCGLAGDEDEGWAVIQEVYDYLVQLSYALGDVWSRGPSVNIPRAQRDKVFCVTQDADCHVNTELGFGLGWSVDAFAQVAMQRLLTEVEAGTVEVNDLLREWMTERYSKTAGESFAAWMLAKKSSKKAAPKLSKIGGGKRPGKGK